MEQLHDIIKYLQGKLTTEESNALNAWRSVSPQNEDFFDSVREIYAMENDPRDIRIFNTEEKWAEIEDQIGEDKPKKIFRLKWVAIAASLLILAGAAFLFLRPDPLYREVVTTNKPAKIVLADQSVVELGPDSKLKYFTRISKNLKERIIYLQGNARIEVTKNDHLPFIVVSGKTGTSVIGTIFEIRQPDSVHTILSNIEGLVKFYELSDNRNAVIVREGESYRYDGNGFTNITPVEEVIPEPIIAPVVKFEPKPLSPPVVKAPPVEEKPVELPPPPKVEPPVDKTVYTSVEKIIDELSNRYAGKFNTAPWGKFTFNSKVPFDLTKFTELGLEDFLKELSKVAKVEYRQTCPDCFELVTLTSK